MVVSDSNKTWLKQTSRDDLKDLLDVYINVKIQDVSYKCDFTDSFPDCADTTDDVTRSTWTQAESLNENGPMVLKCFPPSSKLDLPSAKPTKDQLIHVAQQLRDISDTFHLQRVDCNQINAASQGLNSEDLSIVREILQLHQPSVSDIAGIVLKKLTPETLGSALDILIKNVEERELQIGLSFDLIGAMYAVKGSFHVPSWVRTLCVQRLSP